MHYLCCLLLPIFLLIGSETASAQQITGGLKFGLTHTTFSGNLIAGETTWESVTGIAGGLTSEWHLIGGLSLVGEILYLRMGAKTEILEGSSPYLLTSRSAYLSSPILVQYRFRSSRVIRPRIFIGGAALILLESAIILESRTDGQIFIEEDESIKSFDYGPMAGLGLDFYLSSQRLSLETRYYRGQRDVTKPASDIVESTVLNNQGWAIMATLFF